MSELAKIILGLGGGVGFFALWVYALLKSAERPRHLSE